MNCYSWLRPSAISLILCLGLISHIVFFNASNTLQTPKQEVVFSNTVNGGPCDMAREEVIARYRVLMSGELESGNSPSCIDWKIQVGLSSEFVYSRFVLFQERTLK